MADGLPEGFTIDKPTGLPEGFTIDRPAAHSRLDDLTATVTDIPHQIYEAGKSALHTTGDAFNPYSDANKAKLEAAKASPWDITQGMSSAAQFGKSALGIPQLVAAPITGTGRSVIGHAFDAAAPHFSEADKAKLSAAGVRPYSGEEVADLAMSAAAPARGGLPSAFGRGSAPPVPPQTGPLGVTLSEGQATGELPLIQREQAALRGTSGAPAQNVAQQFFDQQRAQVLAAREGVSRSLDPYGAPIAETPQEAGRLVSEGLQGAAASRKASVDAAYKQARTLPGEIHADAFKGMPQNIRTDLTLREEPVIIDQGTPSALKMIDYLQNKVGDLKIPNAADPFGVPNPENITGVNLKGIDQWRKALVAFKRDAVGNSADMRAAKAVLDSFDSHIDGAVNGGLFNGDPRAIQAWNDARAAHADYKRTFSAGKNDPTGRVVEKILGKNDNPAAIPNDVADFLYGSSGVNPSSLNVNVANRVKSILGDRSPEWSGVKQGLFSRLAETPQGVADYGPGKVAQRINRFLNGDGKELAETIYSAQERELLQRFANVQRQLEVPQSGANWSNTSTFMNRAMNKLGGVLSFAVTSALGHAAGLPWGVAEAAAFGVTKVAGKVGDIAQAKAVSRQLPLVANAVKKYQKALDAYNKAQSPLSQKTLSLATVNLGRSLKPLGINLESLGANSGAINAPADQSQQ